MARRWTVERFLCTLHCCATAFYTTWSTFLMWIDGRTRGYWAARADQRRLIAVSGQDGGQPARPAGPGRASWVARGGTSLASDNAVVTMNAPTCIKRRRPAIVARPNRDLWLRSADSPVDAGCGGKSTGQVPASRDLPSLISHALRVRRRKILNQHD